MAKIITSKAHTSGIALGGIGTGTVELLPDGEFHYWQIANPERFTTVSWEKEVDDGENSTGALSFYVRTKDNNGKTVVRKLGMKTDPRDFTYRMFAWNKPVEKIAFDGRFPVCNIDYIDNALPCNVSLKAISPFVPHKSDVSATPGFYLDFTVENPTDKEIEISLLGTIQPDFANEGGCENSFTAFGDTHAVFMKPATETDKPNCGNLCFSVSSDGEKSHITADFRKYIKEYVAYSNEYGVTQESVLFDFRDNGRLNDSDYGKKPADIPEEIENADIDALYDEYTKLPFAVSLLERVRQFDPSFPSAKDDKINYLRYIKQQIERMDCEFGSSALCSATKLAPNEKKTVRFILTWYFPNHLTAEGKKLGHYYENLYKDSLEANRFLAENNYIAEAASAFSDLIFNTDMPTVYPESWSSHLATLVKCSWYLKDGKFGLWEGLGYCGFHTTDITYHASFGLLVLFPELQKRQMIMGAAFQREDGRVHHFFTPDLEHVDDGFDRVDMNMQFVMMVLRDYLYTGDKEYMESLWGNVVRAMDSIESLDTDKDGLPDSETKRNTYDAWNFSGTPTYISVLWISALNAAVRIAEIMNDSDRIKHWNDLLIKGRASLEEKLWNGKYYNLWCNETQADESLMSDQLDGEWFIRMAGIGSNFTDERVKSVLEFIFNNNFDDESGLINAKCPEGKSTSIHTFNNCQATAVWTGIGYAYAALAISAGLDNIAEKIVESIHENQMRFGAFWDHWECGHHYTRPLSSWTTLTAAAGLKVNTPEKTIIISPSKEKVTLPLCLCNATGTITVNGDDFNISLIEGNLDDWKITIDRN